jgi:nucleoside-diphosphate-sugar epimerase
MTQKTLLSFGHGYSARTLARLLLPQGWRIIGTCRSPEKAAALEADGIEPRIWPGGDGLTTEIERDIAAASHVLSSVPPGDAGDPVLADWAEALAAATPAWVGYLSTVGVYGDHAGGWVDETTPVNPSTARGQRRVDAERAWQALPLPVHVFRIAGIYGPGRGPFARVRAGTARRIIKPGQVFSRIHVEDIAQVLAASMARPDPGAVYNLCDDDPAPPQDVIAHAADLLGLPRPPEVPFEEADLSPMGRSFYSESKRVRNDRIKRDLGVTLHHPDYRSGLRALLEDEG